MGTQEPKILFPVLGKPLLAHLVELLQPLVHQLVVVCAPSFDDRIRDTLDGICRMAHACVVQPTPQGMADAVLCAEKVVHHPNTLVIWGDQIAIRPQTLKQCQTLHEAHSDAVLTFPTTKKPNPYIRLVRNRRGRITAIEEAREGTLTEVEGENDCGVFCFRTGPLFRALHQYRFDPRCRGNKTQEYNLLPLIPLIDQGSGQVLTLPVDDPAEAQGINTKEEALAVERTLLRRQDAS